MMREFIKNKNVFTILVLMFVVLCQAKAVETKKICKGSSVVLHGPKNFSAQWFKDGVLFAKTRDVTVTASGKYEVIAINEFGCSSDVSEPYFVEVIDVPSSVSISGNNVSCGSAPVTLTASNSNNTNIEYEWYRLGETVPFGSGKVIQYVITKNETLVVKNKTDLTDCGSSATIDLISEAPIGEISVDFNVIKRGDKVKFVSTFTNAIRFEWSFGDGTTSTLQNPEHTYKATGNMSVRLKAFSASGCVSEVVKNNFIEVGTTSGGAFDPPKGNDVVLDDNPFKFKIYPNPVIDDMMIELFAKTEQQAVIEYYTMDGKILFKYEEKVFKGNNKFKAKGTIAFTPNSNFIVRVKYDGIIEVFQIFKTK